MRNVLVTGGAGFIGSNFVRYLLQTEPEIHVINYDALTYAGSLENLKGLPGEDRYTFVKGDITDRNLVDEVLRKYDIDTVIHFAAETHVDRSIVGPGQFIQTNIVGTYTLLEAVRQFWIGEKFNCGIDPIEGVRFHHVSTDEVYGTLAPDEPAFKETTPYAPNSPYAASKASSDHLVRSYYHTYGLPVTITNCSNNYGPYQFPEKLIPLIVLNCIDGQPLPVYGDGQQIRDWLYVEDHCDAIWKVVREGKLGETFNVGGDNQPLNLIIIRTICEIMDELAPESPHVPHENLIRFVADRPGHDRRYAMDITKIKQELDWQPRRSLQSGLVETVKWYLDHPDWVDHIRKQQDYQGWVDRNYTQRGEKA